MYQIKVDTHTHTVISRHAYGTVEENVIHAAKAGLEGIAITDHFGPIFANNGELSKLVTPINNMAVLPKVCYGVRLLHGVEIDIIDFQGHLAGYADPFHMDPRITICEKLLSNMEVVIASVHIFEGYRNGSILDNTKMYVNVLQNPKVHILGHCGRAGLPFELDPVLLAAKENGKMIEINSHSFNSGREASDICTRIAVRCAELSVPIVLGSDAHCSFSVGAVEKGAAMLESIGFPEQLLMNRTLKDFLPMIKSKG